VVSLTLRRKEGSDFEGVKKHKKTIRMRVTLQGEKLWDSKRKGKRAPAANRASENRNKKISRGPGPFRCGTGVGCIKKHPM